jgi:hypothetical protein
MNADPKRQSHDGDQERLERARRLEEESLDEALANTFPASDPVSIEQPGPPAVDRDTAAAKAALRSRGPVQKSS